MKIVNTFLLALFAFSAHSATIYVNGAAPAGGDGSSWATAFNTIDPAFAAPSGSDIWVAGGTYLMAAANRALANNVNIYGGFAGTETQVSQRVFSGNLPAIQTVLKLQYGAGYLFWLTGTTNRFDGLAFSSIGGILQFGGTVTAVSDAFIADPDGGGAGAVAGGGISTSNGGTLVVDKSLFQNIAPTSVGGGVAGVNAASVTVTNSTFTGNQAQDTTYWDPSSNSIAEISGGGAIYVDGNFYYYYFNYGPPVNNTKVTLSGNSFYSNSGSGPNGGGAIHVGNAGVVSITNSTFGATGSPNTASYGGVGGAISLNAITSATVTGNSFSSNVSGTLGGAISSKQQKANATVSITSNRFTQNSANYGGAIADVNEASSSGQKTVTLSITGNTFSQNTAPNAGAAIYYDNSEAKVDGKTATAAIDNAIVNSNTGVRTADISP